MTDTLSKTPVRVQKNKTILLFLRFEGVGEVSSHSVRSLQSFEQTK